MIRKMPASLPIELTPIQFKKKIRIITKEWVHIIDKASIVYVQADGNYSHIQLENQQSLLASQTLKCFQEKLPTSFIRIHQSFLINPVFLTKVSSSYASLFLQDQFEIPIARRCKQRIQRFLSSEMD